MVRLSQNFNNNIPLVDGHGNLGSLSGDSAAAQRYTEARLAKFSQDYLLQDIRKNAVDTIPTYDMENNEPVVLPSKVPLLLINGTTGIAAGGYASEIPPHNVIDICKMVIKLIEKPDTSLDYVLKNIKPDFPTGGILCSNNDIEEAYRTGRGNVKYRAKIVHEEKKGRSLLVITEIPWGKTIGGIMENIVSQARVCKENPEPIITEISDIRDESAKGNVRIVIEVKRDADPNVLENKLYKHTDCQVVQKIILIATKFDTFKVYNIKELFTEWILFRIETIRRICLFDIKKYKNRIHILEGLIIALAHIDEVVAIIKKAKDINSASLSLQSKFKLSEIQASAILDMKLNKLTGLERTKLETETSGLIELVENLLETIKDQSKINQIIINDQKELIEKMKKNIRKTACTDIDTDVTNEDVIMDEDFLITISKDKYIKRIKHDFKNQKRGGKGSSSGKTKEGDFIESMFYANSKDHLLTFTNTGRIFDIKVWQIDESSLSGIGKSINGYLTLLPNETVTTILNISNDQFENQNGFLMFATENGLVKKTSMSEFSNIRESGIIAIRIKEGDTLLNVKYIDPEYMQDIFMVTKNGLAIRFSHDEIAPALRPTFGMFGIDLKPKDKVVSFDIVESDECYAFFVTKNGLGKKTLIKNEIEDKETKKLKSPNGFIDAGFPNQKRFGKGRICCQLKEKDELVKSSIGYDNQDVIIISNKKVLSTSTDNFNTLLRPTYGTRIIDLDKGDKVVDMIIVKNMTDIEENKE